MTSLSGENKFTPEGIVVIAQLTADDAEAGCNIFNN